MSFTLVAARSRLIFVHDDVSTSVFFCVFKVRGEDRDSSLQGTPVEDGEDEEKLIRNKGSEDERRQATPAAVEDGERHLAHMEGREDGEENGGYKCRGGGGGV
ncbi:hypothetical protein E2562_034658 [Oryza meyeriana var. granulata]|uniref:Uncharacterized protein n=1 Tax=Oryza meyeriana var. granulata TaxID=110450 RepID=A0A6G1EBC7_9ORYZ|nr:hypothetical protein E2562_020632 [Oryza meyeriana var. granulata]KAF0922415.1 hypothetical protein E2562_034658 [Oryza meyeriana var. granulata]